MIWVAHEWGLSIQYVESLTYSQVCEYAAYLFKKSKESK